MKAALMLGTELTAMAGCHGFSPQLAVELPT
jgi:hypothetical protein